MLNRSPGRPAFGDYLRVMRRGPRFWLSVALCLAAFGRLALSEPFTEVLVALGIGLAGIVAFFPLWRIMAARSPELATEGHPELLNEIQIDGPMHPSEPGSNVRRIEDE